MGFFKKLMSIPKPYQPSLFDQPVKRVAVVFDMAAGKKLADEGMNRAVEKADYDHDGWKQKCWQLFWQWLNRKPRYFEFMIEDFREYLMKYDLLEKPNSDRAFGFISQKALKMELIIHAGTRQVRNKKAHRATANVWVKK